MGSSNCVGCGTEIQEPSIDCPLIEAYGETPKGLTYVDGEATDEQGNIYVRGWGLLHDERRCRLARMMACGHSRDHIRSDKKGCTICDALSS